MAKPRVYEIAKDLGLDSKTVLEKLKDHPLVADVLTYRQYAKLKSTYADGRSSASSRQPWLRRATAQPRVKAKSSRRQLLPRQPRSRSQSLVRQSPVPLSRARLSIPPYQGPSLIGTTTPSSVAIGPPLSMRSSPSLAHAPPSRGPSPLRPSTQHRAVPRRSVRILQARAQAIIHSAVSRACILRRRVIFRVRIRWLARR